MNSKVQSIKILVCSASGLPCQLEAHLARNHIEVEQSASLDKALTTLERERYSALLVFLSGKDREADELEKLSVVRKLDPTLPAVVVCGNDSLEVERKARLQGVFYYFLEPVDESELVEVLREAVRFRYRKVRQDSK